MTSAVTSTQEQPLKREAESDRPPATAEVVAALAKQMGLEEANVNRIFMAGVDHAERTAKRRRLQSEAAGDERGAQTSPPDASAVIPNFRFSLSTTLEQLRDELADFAKERDWDQFHGPRNLALAMVGEVGELCECFQWKGEVPEGLPGWTDKERTNLSQELADVLLYLVRLSHKCRVDLPQAALNKLAVNAAKYPAAMVRGSSKKYNEYRTASRNGPTTEAASPLQAPVQTQAAAPLQVTPPGPAHRVQSPAQPQSALTHRVVLAHAAYNAESQGYLALKPGDKICLKWHKCEPPSSQDLFSSYIFGLRIDGPSHRESPGAVSEGWFPYDLVTLCDTF